MKLGFRVALCAALLSSGALAQDTEAPSPIAPFTISEAAVSGLDLPPREIPDKPGKEFYQLRLYRGEALSVYALGGETMRNVQTGFPLDEYIQYINGHAEIKAANTSFTLLGGDYAIGPKGWVGVWTNNGGPRHNLELSVISTKRSEDSSAREAPFPINRETLAGLTTRSLVGGEARDVVYRGPELTVTVITQEPGARAVAASDPEVFVHILNGAVTLTPEDGEPIRYHLGDSFILPTGFVGQWNVEGRNGLRIIEVVANL